METIRDRFTTREGLDVWASEDSESTDGMPVLEGWAVTYRDRANFSGRIVVPGAFKESLATRPIERYPIVMGYEHSSFQGTNPIGAWHAYSDEPDVGLHLREGRVSKTSLGQDVATLVRDRAVNGLSVGFIPLDGKMAMAGEEVEFETPYGKRSYTVHDEDEAVVFVTRATLLETSVVSTPADDEGRLTHVQSIREQAVRALPGLDEEASFDDLRYSMALLMGGRGAGHDFRDLPLLERVAMYQRLAAGYARHGATPPAFDSAPEWKRVQFKHDERHVFSERYLVKRLSDAVAGARGLSGPISREGCAMALQLNRELVARAGDMPAETRRQIRELVAELTPRIEETESTDLVDAIGEVLALLRS